MNATFTAYEYSVGIATVEFSASGALNCSGTLSTFTGEALAWLTIPSPLSLSQWIPKINPVLPGESVLLSTTVSGGVPPFTATFSFGDGNSSEIVVGEDEQVSLTHRYLTGVYRPSIRAVDAFDEETAAPIPDSIYVNANLSSAIVLSSQSVDEGLPFTVTVDTVGGVAPYAVEWNDGKGDSSTQNTWTLLLNTPGFAVLSVTVTDSLGQEVGIRTAK